MLRAVTVALALRLSVNMTGKEIVSIHVQLRLLERI